MLLLQLLALTLASLLVCYGLGRLLSDTFRVAPNEPFFGAFLHLLTGIVVLAVGYALVCTRAATILLPVLALVLGMLYAQRSATGKTHLTLPPLMLVTALLGVGLVVFAGQYLLLYEPGTPFLQTPFQDYVYYSRLTLPLRQLGLETNSLEVVYPQFQTEQPYHYLETWFNTLLVALTGLPSVWVFFVSASSVLLTTCAIGFTAIYAHCGLRSRSAVMLGLVSLTIVGTAWPLLCRFSFIANGGLLANIILAINPKLTPVYLFTLLGALLLLRQQWSAAALALAVLPLVFVATAPAVGIGIAGLVVYLWLSRRWCWWRAGLLLMPMIGALLYLLTFYAVQPEPYQFPATGRSLIISTIIPKAGELHTLFNIALGVFINYGIYYSGYALLVLGLLWRAQRSAIRTADYPLLVLFTATLVGAVLMRTFGHHFLDGFQFFSNPMIPFTAVMVALLLGRTLSNAPGHWPTLTAIVLLGLLLINARHDIANNTSYSPAFLRQVGPVLELLPNRGGYLLSDEEYENAYMMSSDSYTTGNYVSNFKNDYTLLSLSELVPDSLTTDPRFARDSVQAEQIRRKSTIYRLAKFRSLAHRPISTDSLPLALVHQARLAFICTSRKAILPTSLRSLVRTSYYDNQSGETLYVLK